MYTFSSKLKLASIILMVVGVLGIGLGFMTTSNQTHESAEMVHESHAKVAAESTVNHVNKSEISSEHKEVALHEAENRPWSALYIAMFYFLMLAICVMVFYAIQIASQAGWSIVLFRVMEGITAYILPGSLLLLGFLIITAMGGNHLFSWMNPELYNPKREHYDAILAGKSGYLNIPFWLIRAFFYVLIWNGYRFFTRRNSIKLDKTNDLAYYKRSFKATIIFLLLFFVTESTMSWDWIMSITPHWYSTLFAWYIFASFIVSAIAVITIITVYLRHKGFLPHVNDSHLHDLATYMFGFSIFWTYLWFAQFLLQWYANIPEEATYFVPRLLGTYQPLFIGMLITNFVLPILLLMDSDYKRIPFFIVLTSIIILIGHYVDLFIMIEPSTIGNNWSFGIPEISSMLFFAGLFIYVVFNALTKVPLHAKGNPFMKESEIYHY